MVRRWSCVNTINISIDFKNFSYFLKKRYKFVNFKSSLSLKRFNKKYTKFKRKAFNRIKHLKNWNIYHNVFNIWAKSYSFYKKVNKIQFLNFNMQNTFTFYNFVFLTNKIDLTRAASFTFFNNIKNQNNHLNHLIVYNPYYKNLEEQDYSRKHFFLNACLQINEPLLEKTNTHTFFLKDQTNVLFQNYHNKNASAQTSNKFFFKKIIFLKLKLLLEYYRVINLIIRFNVC